MIYFTCSPETASPRSAAAAYSSAARFCIFNAFLSCLFRATKIPPHTAAVRATWKIRGSVSTSLDDSATTNTVAAAAAHLDSFVRHHLERRRRCVIEHARPEPPKKGAKATFTVHQAHGLRNTKFAANFALGLQARLDDIKRIGYLWRKREGAEDAQEGSNWKNDVPSCWTILRQHLQRSVWRE